MKMNGLLPEANYADCANGYRIHYLDDAVQRFAGRADCWYATSDEIAQWSADELSKDSA